MIYTRVNAAFAYAGDSLWRSLYVRGDITLEEFGCALLVSLRAEFEHSFQFEKKGRWYVPESYGDFSSAWTPMRGHTLDELGDEFDFEYDTGDGWDFHCKVFKNAKEIDSDRMAIFDGGAGMGIWEDGILSFNMAVTGQVRPNRTRDKEEVGFYMPRNLPLKRVGDMNDPLDPAEEQSLLDVKLPGAILLVTGAPMRKTKPGKKTDAKVGKVEDAKEKPDGEETISIPIPEKYTKKKLKSLYEYLPLTKKELTLLLDYMEAMANLYGILWTPDACEIIMEQNPDLFLSPETFRDFTLIARHEKHLAICGLADTYRDEEAWLSPYREILDPGLLSGAEDLYDTLASGQRGKPRYVPPKEELLKYKDAGYSEPTPQKAALAAYLKKKLGNAEAADTVLREMTIMIRKTPNLKAQEIMDFVGRMGVTFQNRDDAQELMELYADYSNNTRMQFNNGYTPEELYRESVRADIPLDTGHRKVLVAGEEADKSPVGKRDVREGILDALSGMPENDLRKKLADAVDKPKDGTAPVWSGDLIQAQKYPKVGRNDPCPCGSGKKYKKCHGRSEAADETND